LQLRLRSRPEGLGGWLGLITAALAWYGSCAGVANVTWKRTPLQSTDLSRRCGAHSVVPTL
jgi:hypothetical protein